MNKYAILHPMYYFRRIVNAPLYRTFTLLIAALFICALLAVTLMYIHVSRYSCLPGDINSFSCLGAVATTFFARMISDFLFLSRLAAEILALILVVQLIQRLARFVQARYPYPRDDAASE